MHAIAFQIIKSGHPKADEIVLSNMTVALDRIFLDVVVSFDHRIICTNCVNESLILHPKKKSFISKGEKRENCFHRI